MTREREFSLKFRQSFFLTFIPAIWLITGQGSVRKRGAETRATTSGRVSVGRFADIIASDSALHIPSPRASVPGWEPTDWWTLTGLRIAAQLHATLQIAGLFDGGLTAEQQLSFKINDRFNSQAMTNFHLLYYLYGLDCFGTKMKTQMTPLMEAVRTQDRKMAEQFMKGDTWSTLEHLIGAHSGQEWVELNMTNCWRLYSIFFSSPVTEIFCRHQLIKATGRVIIARSSTMAKHRPARCAACLVKQHLRSTYKIWNKWIFLVKPSTLTSFHCVIGEHSCFHRAFVINLKFMMLVDFAHD